MVGPYVWVSEVTGSIPARLFLEGGCVRVLVQAGHIKLPLVEFGNYTKKKHHLHVKSPCEMSTLGIKIF